nr:putative P5a protein [Apple luteovirus 1]
MKFRNRLQRPPFLQSDLQMLDPWSHRNLNRYLLRNLNRKSHSLQRGSPLCRLTSHSGQSQ